jgi:hypothetical protein
MSHEIGGAKSSEQAVMFHKLPVASLMRLVKRYTAGVKHESKDDRSWAIIGGVQNWQQGNAEYATERFNHALVHLLKWKEQYETGVIDPDDNLAAAAWGLILLMDYEERGIIAPGQKNVRLANRVTETDPA